MRIASPTRRQRGRDLSRRRGLALALVLMVVSIAAIVAFGAAAVSSRNLNFAATDLCSIKARYASEAGAADALQNLEEDPGWNTGLTNVPLPGNDGVKYSVSVTNNAAGTAMLTAPDGTAVPPATVYLLSSGTSGPITRRTRILTRVGVSTIYRYAAYGKTSIDMDSNANTDSYSSANGPYGGANVSANGSVATEGTLSLDSNSTIHGNTSAATYLLKGTAIITGVKGGAPNVTLPAIDFATPATSNNNASGFTVSGMNYNASTKTLSGAGTITFNQGGTYYFNSIDISSNSTLVVSPSVTSPVKIYVAGNYHSDSNYFMNNNTNKPNNLQFLVGGEVDINSNSIFYGTIYAPNGSVIFRSNTILYGSVISGGNLSINSNQALHYDTTLAANNGSSTIPTVLVWERQ